MAYPGPDRAAGGSASPRDRVIGILVTATAFFLLAASLIPVAASALVGFAGVLRVLDPDTEPREGIYLPAAFGPFLIALAVVAALAAIAHAMAAVGLLAHRRWGQVLGLVVGVVGLVLAAGSVISRISNTEGVLGLDLLLVAGYAFAVVVLSVAPAPSRRRA